MGRKAEDINISFRKGTTGHDILNVLKEADGSYPEENLKKILSDKQPDTVRKMVRRLEKAGYVFRKKGYGGEIFVVLRTEGQRFLNVEMVVGSTPQKITRHGNIGVTNLMFKRSIPFGNQEEIQKNTYYMTKKQIVEQVPKSGKVLCTSRFIGVYVHYGEYIPVFKIGSSMYWVDNAEQQVRDYLAVQIFATPIRKAIFLIEDYDYEAMRLVERPEQRPNWGQSLRDSLELSSCYRKVFLFTDDKTGVEQLRLFRSYAMIEERFLDIVFEDDEKSDRENSIVNGYIDDKRFIVFFSGDIINIKRLRRMLENGLLDHTFIVCYDFQEKFLREVFYSWRDRVTFRSFSLEEVLEVIHSGEDDVDS